MYIIPVCICPTNNIITDDWYMLWKRNDHNNSLYVTNKSSQQMQPNIYLYCICSHLTCFEPLLAHHQGCLGLLVYATIWFMQCCCMSVHSRSVALSSRQGHRPLTHGHTTALHEPNGGINKQPKTPLMMGQ
jgi:hypothetical protein